MHEKNEFDVQSICQDILWQNREQTNSGSLKNHLVRDIGYRPYGRTRQLRFKKVFRKIRVLFLKYAYHKLKYLARRVEIRQSMPLRSSSRKHLVDLASK